MDRSIVSPLVALFSPGMRSAFSGLLLLLAAPAAMAIFPPSISGDGARSEDEDVDIVFDISDLNFVQDPVEMSGFAAVNIISVPTNGKLFVNGAPQGPGVFPTSHITSNTFIYVPNANFSGADSFEYRVRDFNGDESVGSAFMNITVDPVSDAPDLSVSNVIDDEDTAVVLDIVVTLEDPSETLSDVELTGVNGTLSAGTDNGGGSWTVEIIDLPGLELTRPIYYYKIELSTEKVVLR